jgi:hypothetical protein
MPADSSMRGTITAREFNIGSIGIPAPRTIRGNSFAIYNIHANKIVGVHKLLIEGMFPFLCRGSCDKAAIGFQQEVTEKTEEGLRSLLTIRSFLTG